MIFLRSVQSVRGDILLQIRKRLTYSNVTATIALFVALGGASAFAATHMLPRNSVGSRQLRRNSVTGAKIKNGAVTAAKIAPGAIGSTQIDASKLGTVPSAANATNAAALGGTPSSGFLKSSQITGGAGDPFTTSQEAILTIPGLVEITTIGNKSATLALHMVNLAPEFLSYVAATESGRFTSERNVTLSGSKPALLTIIDGSDSSHIASLQCAIENEETFHVIACTAVSTG
jgi:hypothetical protein